MENLELQLKVAKLEEWVVAADKALKIAADALDAWKASSNEWRQALGDQRSMFVSRSEVIAMIVVGLTVLGLVLRYTH